MILELNINLHVIGRDDSQAERDARNLYCRKFIRKHFASACFNRRDEDGRDLLVARINANNTTMDRAEHRVAQLAVQIQQHCIACYFPDYQRGLGIGVLVGPKANEWTDFSIHAFTRYRPGYASSKAFDEKYGVAV